MTIPMANGASSTSPDVINTTILIVGAGPVGVYLAVRLAALEIPVILLESSLAISDAPRAVTHMPIMFAEFKRAGKHFLSFFLSFFFPKLQ